LTEEIEEFRKVNDMSLEGRNIPRPIMNFDHTQWPNVITKLFKSNGFDKPTPIQSQGWPMALTGRNLVYCPKWIWQNIVFYVTSIVACNGQPPLYEDLVLPC